MAALLNKQPPTKLEAIDLSKATYRPEWMTRAFRNNRYVIMINDNAATTHGPAIRCMVQKIDNTPINFHWRSMQAIKNEIFGREATAIEYYPAHSELIDDKNIYWMWVFPDGVIPKPV